MTARGLVAPHERQLVLPVPSGYRLITSRKDSSMSATTEFLLRRNVEISTAFNEEPNYSRRERYVAKHATKIAALTCMDGRLDFAVFTELPPGIITAFRNIGEHFDLGWPLLKESMCEFAHEANRAGTQAVVLCTYHFSKGDPHRGCAGNDYDIAKSIELSRQLVDQFHRVFGTGGDGAVIPLLVGMETDEDGLIFHRHESAGDLLSSTSADRLDVAENVEQLSSEASAAQALATMYPFLAKRVVADLVPLVVGNASHVTKVRNEKRSLTAMCHMESIIAVGRGFSWLHLENKALIVGPFEESWASSVAVAGKIVLSNIQAGRIDAVNGVLLLVCAPCAYPRGNFDWRMSEEKAIYMAKVAMSVLKERVPQLFDTATVEVLLGVEDRSLRLTVIDATAVHAAAM